MIATPVFQLDAWKKRRPSFTLVELLIVISIIGILAGMIMYTLAGAQQDAKSARTRGTIKKISDIVLARWEEFRYRAVKITVPEDFLLPYQVSPTEWQLKISPKEGARTRLIVLRDVMRMELPDRYSDIAYTPSKYRLLAYTADDAFGNATPNALVEPLDSEVPGIYQTYRRKMIMQPDPLSSINPWPWNAGVMRIGILRPSVDYQGAELLYQIVSASNYNGGSALEYFRPSEIGDVDGDGFPEFLDAWGNPIRWLRWPSGSSSPMNDKYTPDALDPLKTDWRWVGQQQRPWLLVPLVVSAGPDGVFDTVFDFDPNTNLPCVDPSGGDIGLVCYATNQWTAVSNDYKQNGPYYYPDPYIQNSGVALGQTVDLDGDGIDGSIDNISNYELLLQ